MPLDLSSLRSVYKFTEDVKSLNKPIQLLICNAGIGNASQGNYSIAHIESIWLINPAINKAK